MKPVEQLASATAPDGSVVTLSRHDGAYLMSVDGVELMSTRRTNSEVQLAALACDGLATFSGATVLIGGLGFGATLRAALERLSADARVVVAEIMPEVLAWNRNAEWSLAGDALADPRVEVRIGDVFDVMRTSPGAFDALMLDVDNGAESFTTGSNSRLYAATGIRHALSALKPGGVLAYWSVDREPGFVRALERERLVTAVHKARSHATSGGYNYIIVARQPPRG